MGKITFVGHHGTSSNDAHRILGSNFTVNFKHIGSLGTGIYFFEKNYILAAEYAKHRHNGQQIKIIECIFEISKEKIFDTVKDQGDIKTFHEYRNEIKESLMSRGNRNVRTRNMNEFDGKIYNFISSALNKDLIRANTFTPLLSDRKHNVPLSNVPNGIELCLKRNIYVKDKYIYHMHSQEEGLN